MKILDKIKRLTINRFSCILLLLISYFIFPIGLYSQAGFTPDMRLTYRQGKAYSPRAACFGDTIHIVWWQHYAHDEIFYKRSTDCGMTWSNDTVLSIEDDTAGYSPDIALYNNNIHVVWYDIQGFYNAICYRRSTDGGNTWDNIQKIVKDPNYRLHHTRICIAKNNLFVAAIKSMNGGRLLFTKSTDNGATWSDSITITTATQNLKIINPKDDSLFLFVAAERFPYYMEITTTYSHDGGITWSDSFYVSDYDSISSFYPSATIDSDGGIHVAWCDYKYTPYSWTGDIFYRNSRDSGNTWQPIDSLTVFHRANKSDILAVDNTLHLVWDDERNGPSSNFELYYRLSTDLGQTWQPEVRLTYAPKNSTNPAIVTDGTLLHLFWIDDRDTLPNSSNAIYYKRKNLLGIADREPVNSDNVGLNLICPTIVKGSFSIRYDLGDNKSGTITLIDLAGRTVEIKTVDANRKETYININKEKANGLYFLMLNVGIHHRIKKVVVIR